MLRTCLTAALTAAVFSLPFAAADETPATSAVDAKSLDQKILAEAKAKSEIMANLGYLSDIIGPRLTGSASLKNANDWTAEKMKSYGPSGGVGPADGAGRPAAWNRDLRVPPRRRDGCRVVAAARRPRTRPPVRHDHAARPAAPPPRRPVT